MSAFSPAIREFLAVPDAARRLGPYLCKDVLDKAGTAPVFRAVEEHAGLSLRDVAVKVFDIGPAKAGAGGESWQARVLDEARALCRVQHPNVIRFHTLSTDPKRGLMGIVMEFADGVSVAGRLAEVPRGDARRVALAVEIGIHVASALAAAHDAGIVHCNVKPSNIMFTGGTHKLINFGLAASLGPAAGKKDAPRALHGLDDLTFEAVGRKASTLEKAGADEARTIAGTLGYVDPVCLKTTAPPTASSDLYALGATLYECLAGDVPVLATAKKRGDAKLDAKILLGDAPPAPLAEVAPATPPALAKLVDALVAPARDARPRSADAVFRTLERVRSTLAGHDRELPPEDRGPFPGLERYEAADRDVFFGRSAETAGVIELLRTRGLVAVVGLSGTGKSSLARAGVLPSVEEGALGGWPPKYASVIVTPGSDLTGALDKALAKVLGAPLAQSPEAAIDQLAAHVDTTGQGLLLLIDQFEELVLLRDEKREPTRGLELLSRIADAPVGLRALVTVRRDLLDEVLAVDSHFARALSRGIQLLGPLAGPAWEEVLDQSLEAYGYRIEDADLRREILQDLRARDAAMPLAQFGLTRLWAARGEKKKVIPRDAFDAKGGMRGALEHHADEVVRGLAIPREKLRELLLTMTTSEGTRAHAPRDVLTKRFGEPGKAAILALSEAHLLTEDDAGVTFLHDSILREWSLVRGWLDDARDDRRLAEHIERDAARWSEAKDAVEPWRKGRLESALELWRRQPSLSSAAREFLTHSAREERKMRLIVGGLVTLVLAIIVGGSIAYAQDSRAHAEALAAALAQVKTLKQQAEEAAGEAAASAELLHDLQQKMAKDEASYGAQVQATIKKVESATSLDGAKTATQDLKGRSSPAQNQVVPLPRDLVGTNGPKLDTSGPSPSAGGGAFDEASIERVVNSRKAGVKRTCLERSTSTASTTKITTTLTIAPSGQVQNVTSSGDDPVVAKCIEHQLSSWSFPAPGEVKQVQIPFVFVRQ